jgi:hypothetical protein
LTNRDYIIVIAAAFIGALGSGVAGWWDSNEPFEFRKFMGSVWSALFAAMLFALGYDKINDLGVANFITAFLGGAGVDVIGNRVQGGINNRQPDLPTRIAKLENDLLNIIKARSQKVADKEVTNANK